MTSNQIAFSKAVEDARHNRVSERHEHYDTRSRRMQAEASLTQAETGRQQLGINWWTAQETQRANKAKEAETYRHNYQDEQLKMYSYMTAASAAQDQARAALRQAGAAERTATIRESELAEALRRNQVLEGFTQKEIAETVRRNKAQESISRAQVGETSRANKVREALEQQSLIEQVRHNKEGEKVATSQAFSASKQASAAETRASASVVSAGAASRQADTAQYRAETDRYDFYRKSVDTGVGIVKDIASTVGGWLK